MRVLKRETEREKKIGKMREVVRDRAGQGEICGQCEREGDTEREREKEICGWCKCTRKRCAASHMS